MSSEKKISLAAFVIGIMLIAFVIYRLNVFEPWFKKEIVDCEKLNPQYNKTYEITNGFYKGQRGTSTAFTSLRVNIWFDNADHFIFCSDLKEVK